MTLDSHSLISLPRCGGHFDIVSEQCRPWKNILICHQNQDRLFCHSTSTKTLSSLTVHKVSLNTKGTTCSQQKHSNTFLTKAKGSTYQKLMKKWLSILYNVISVLTLYSSALARKVYWNVSDENMLCLWHWGILCAQSSYWEFWWMFCGRKLSCFDDK